MGSDARPAILASAVRHSLPIDDALDAMAAQRSLDRLAHHALRALHYLHQLDERTAETPSLAEMDLRAE